MLKTEGDKKILWLYSVLSTLQLFCFRWRTAG